MGLFPDNFLEQLSSEERQEWEESRLPKEASEAYQAAKYDFDLKLLIARARAGTATQMEINLAMDFLEGKIKRPKGKPRDWEIERRNVEIHSFIFKRLCADEKMEAALAAAMEQFKLKRSAVFEAYCKTRKSYIENSEDPYFWSVEHWQGGWG
jgi:hypothetical protein